MHRNEIIYALICINNHVISSLISMLSAGVGRDSDDMARRNPLQGRARTQVGCDPSGAQSRLKPAVDSEILESSVGASWNRSRANRSSGRERGSGWARVHPRAKGETGRHG